MTIVLESANKIIEEGISSGIFSGASVMVAINGEIIESRTYGHVALDHTSARVEPNTLFDVASLTKPVITATSILQLVERGLTSLDKPLDLLPYVTIHQLLTHTSGLPAIPQPGTDTDTLVQECLASPLVSEPGSSFLYSDTGYILLGAIVEQLGGMALDRYACEKIFEPLGMASSTFCPDAAPIVSTDVFERPGLVHDPRARVNGGVAGHAGLFSTANDLLKYAEAIRTGSPSVLSSKMRQSMARSQIPANIGAHSYGWFCSGNPYLPSSGLFSDRAFGHSGFTGCFLLIDPEIDLSLVLLTNRVIAGDDNRTFLKLRRKWLEAISKAYRSNS